MSRVILIGSAFPLRGGLASYNERLAREFLAKGYEVIIYTFSLQYPGFLFPGKTQYSNSPKPDNLDIRVKVNSINPFNWFKVGREIKKLAPDLVVVKFWLPFMGPCLGTIARIIRRNKKTRVISIVDNIIPHEKRPGDRLFARYFARRVDGFIAQSHSVEIDLSGFKLGKPIRFSPHPVFDNFGERLDKKAARQLLGIKTDTKWLLFFGFIRDYKGLDLLLEAMADQRIRERGINLLIAGEYYNNAAEYKSLIDKLGIINLLEERTDFIPDEEVGRYFCAADVIVQPYKSATQSGVTQIGYHFEKPMIVTNVGGLPEIIPHDKAGFVVEPDPKAIADAICRFYDEKKEADFVAFAKEEKKKYSWSRMVEQVEAVAADVQ